MMAVPKRKSHQDDDDSDKRRRQEEALDEALKNTFPASDPVSVVQPMRAGTGPASDSRKSASELVRPRTLVLGTDLISAATVLLSDLEEGGFDHVGSCLLLGTTPCAGRNF
jgi:hypothetical protein